MPSVLQHHPALLLKQVVLTFVLCMWTSVQWCRDPRVLPSIRSTSAPMPLEQLTWGSPIAVEGLRLVILRCVRGYWVCRVKRAVFPHSVYRGLLHLGEEPKRWRPKPRCSAGPRDCSGKRFRFYSDTSPLRLHLLAFVFLSTLTSSVPCERVFSMAGEVVFFKKKKV